MKRSWNGGYLKSNPLRCLDEIRVEAAWHMTLRGRRKYVLVLIWSQELYKLCSSHRGEGSGNRHKWSNYLRMRSLFGSISSRLWLREAQPAKQHNWLCYLIAESASLCKDIFQGSFVHFVRRLTPSSEPFSAQRPTVQVIGRSFPVFKKKIKKIKYFGRVSRMNHMMNAHVEHGSGARR